MKMQLHLWGCAMAMMASYAYGAEEESIPLPLTRASCFNGVDELRAPGGGRVLPKDQGYGESSLDSSTREESVIIADSFTPARGSANEPPTVAKAQSTPPECERPATAGKKLGDEPPAFLVSPNRSEH